MLLKDYVKMYSINIARLCRLSKVARSSMENYIYLRSEPRVSSAVRIVKACGGKVRFEDLCLPEKKEEIESSEFL